MNALGMRNAALAMLPRPGYTRRMRSYLRTMFPLWLHLSLAALLYADLAWVAGRDVAMSRGIAGAAAGIASIVLFALLGRLMDEIKDRELDARFHPARPLPSGLVNEGDLRASQAVVALAILGVGLGNPATLGWTVALLAYSFALSRHLWLRPLLERSPLLTLATHSPLVPALLFYVVALCRLQPLTGARVSPPVVGMVGALWLLVTTAEIARKTRAPGDESGYPTYSLVWGPSRAGLAVLASATAALATTLGLVATFGRTLLITVPCAVGYLGLAARCHLFLRDPTRARGRLGTLAQAFGFLVLATFPADQWILA